jgi:hypothetical protein
MLVRKCDRCGKYTVDLENYVDVSGVDAKSDETLFGNFDGEEGAVELCHRCADALKSWLKISD